MTDVKTISKSVLNSYDNSLSRLTAKYISAISNIDTAYKEKTSEINREKNEKKNSADASAKISLANTKAGLLDRGLSKSGDSVQAELDNNMAKTYAFSEIEKDAEKSRRAAEKSRSEEKISAAAEYLNSVDSLEKEMNKAYIDQLNRDRDYEAEREDERYDRFADNRDYEAEREDERYDRFADNRDYEAEREDERYDRYLDTTKKDSKEEETEEKIVPSYSPKVFVDKIVTNNKSKYYSDAQKQSSETKKAVNAIINDESLDYSYRYQVKIYATALGIL